MTTQVDEGVTTKVQSKLFDSVRLEFTKILIFVDEQFSLKAI